MKYRVVEKMHGQFVSNEVVKTVFEGWLRDLNTKFPLSLVFGADPLSHKEIEDGYVRWDYTFYQSENGLDWNECNDPRSKADRVLSALEREIDAENRRLYPGDYDDFEDDQFDEDLYN